jgi:hypothetical protein
MSSILNERMKRYSEDFLEEYQCGFQPHRSTTDQIFIIRQMMEKFYEHERDVQMIFIDFKQAFDSLCRDELYKALKEMNVPEKLIRLVKMTMENNKVRVKIENKLSNAFTFNAGVKQGDDYQQYSSILPYIKLLIK